MSLRNRSGSARQARRSWSTSADSLFRLRTSAAAGRPQPARKSGSLPGGTMANFVKVASLSELQPGICKTVEAGGKTLALFNVDGTVYALDNTCLHRGGPLGEGIL